ncbi:hypothetical protein BaRGS_00010626 [Batillaria attramentaria]|uniref:5'-Nucleotidase C-terminal domain-containing protein n=1 Tax=Batillaria attramentaria TaxID=370345 RepID=A0ABD0LF45_9CAEN
MFCCQVGVVGLVEEEWMATLPTVDPNDIIFSDFVTEGRRLGQMLKQQGADIVIALTHMRWPNDERLAEEAPEIDIILGGHDHDYDIKEVNGKYVLKSGTDFRNLSKLTLVKNGHGWSVDVERVDLTSDFPQDPDMEEIVHQMLVLGSMGVNLEGRFSIVRTMETNLGNFITDIMLAATHSEVALLNSGTIRSDRIHPKGEFRVRDLLTILPLPDPLVVIRVSGRQLILALENGVGQYPKKEGRFPQVAGISFGFDPTRPRGHRVAISSVRVQGKPLQLENYYSLVTKEYIATGHDGYDVFKECEWLTDSEQCPALTTAVQNHFESVQIFRGMKECKSGHRQPLLPYCRKDTLVRQASIDETGSPRRLSRVQRQESIHDAEEEFSFLCPRVEGRIYILSQEAMAGEETMLHHNLSIIKETSLASSSESLDQV